MTLDGVRISFITVSWRSAAAVARLISSIRRVVEVPYEVIVVNNDDNDRASLEPLRDPAARIQVLHSPVNLGFAAGCNRGAALAVGDILVFINPDVQVRAFPREALDELHVRFGAEVLFTARMLTGGRVARGGVRRFPTGRRVIVDSLGLDRVFRPLRGTGLFYPDEAQLPPFARVEQPIGAFLGIPRRLFERLGGFDERFFVFFEEVDLALRAADDGVPAVLVSMIEAEHKGGHSTQDDRTVAVGLRWRSLRAFHGKHGHRLRLPPATLLIALEAARFSLQRLVPRHGWRFNPTRALRIAFRNARPAS